MKHFINATGAAALLLSAGFASAQTELIFNTFLSPFDPSRKVAVEAFSAMIEAESNGTIIINIPDASLAATSGQYGMLMDGVADMAIIATPDISQFVTLNGIADLPYNVPNAAVASTALWETYKAHFQSFDEYRGLRLLSVHVLPGRQFLGMNGAPVNSAEAISGTKMWVPNGPLTDIVEALGAVPIHVPFPELSGGAETGLFDTLVASPGTALAARIIDKIDFVTEVPGGLGSVSLAVVITNESWNALSTEDQAAIERAANGLPARTGAALDGLEFGGLAKLAHKTIEQASDEFMADLQPILDAQVVAWKEEALDAGLQDPDAVLAFYRSVLEREIAAVQASN